MRYLTSIFVSVFLFVSCYQEFDSPSAKNSPISVSSFISNNKIIKVNLLQSIPINENTQKVYITDATIKLYEDNIYLETLTLRDSTYELNQQTYTTFHYQTEKTTAKIGKTYKIEITTSEGKIMNAVTSIPNPAEIISIDTTRTIIPSDEKDYISIDETFKLKFKDPPGKNFYRITMKTKTGYNSDQNDSITIRKSVYNGFYPLDTIFSYFSQDENNVFSNGTNNFLVFNDEKIEGKEYEISLNREWGNNTWYFSNKGEFQQYIIELQTLTEDGYNYLRSIDLQNQSGGLLVDTPVMGFTNIDNGVGVFTGYSISQKIITIGEYPIDGFTYEYR